MMTARTPRIASRKSPRQARSNQLVEAVLDAAVQVLMKEGAHRFTTARVAERAGVSVGSLYQYFPNKAAILFRLQRDEWQRTSALLQSILEDRSTPPTARLRRLIHAFLLSECEEAAIRTALNDAAPLYRDAPEAVEAKAENAQIFATFLREALPELPDDARRRAGGLIKMTLSGVGAAFSETARSDAEIAAWSDALADMVCGYLDRLIDTPPIGTDPSAGA
ncbi:MAG: TetR family transcriptional regulator [Pseudomonadota bacterium]